MITFSPVPFPVDFLIQSDEQASDIFQTAVKNKTSSNKVPPLVQTEFICSSKKADRQTFCIRRHIDADHLLCFIWYLYIVLLQPFPQFLQGKLNKQVLRALFGSEGII